MTDTILMHTILLVDDDSNVLRALSRCLVDQPYHILTAQSGDEAVIQLKSQTIDVVVSDERMPGMKGSELVTWIAENQPDVVRIILTGQASMPAAIQSINQGRIFCFLTKPTKDTELAMAIRDALDEKDQVIEERAILRATQRLMYEAEAQRQSLQSELSRRNKEAISQQSEFSTGKTEGQAIDEN